MSEVPLYLLNAPLRVSACHTCATPPPAINSATLLPGSLPTNGSTGGGGRVLTALRDCLALRGQFLAYQIDF